MSKENGTEANIITKKQLIYKRVWPGGQGQAA